MAFLSAQRIAPAWFILFAALSPLAAQTALPLDLAVEQDGSFTPISFTSTLNLQAPAVNQGVSLRLRIRNIASGLVTLASVNVIGSHFAVDPAGLPTVLESGASVTAVIRYLPESSTRASGELLLSYSVPAPPGSPPSPTQAARLLIAGVAPEFRTSYMIGTDGNSVAITPGSVIMFPDTVVNASAVASLNVVNFGSGPGAISGVQVAGSAFRAQGLPVFPVITPASGEFRFSVRFTPVQPGPVPEGGLTIQLPGGSLQAALAGTGSAANLTYELQLSGSPAVPITPGQKVSLPSVDVGTRLPIGVRVTNAGNVGGSIASISVLGAAYSLAELPALPVVVPPQGSIVFALNLAPQTAGPANGRLFIGSASFDLEAVGAGSQLLYSYTLSGVSIAVQPLTAIRFPPAQVGESSQVQMVIRNEGNREAILPNLTISPAAGAYTLTGAPALPVRLEPQQSLTLGIVYAPTSLAAETATLTVGSDLFPLAGASSPPPALPPYVISGVSATVQPMEQPAVGLTLDAPYPILLRGELRLNFETAVFADDPSIMFATGGRTAEFTIPAGTREAVFSTGSNRIRFQTGTLSGNIVVVPRFFVGTIELAAGTVLRTTLPPSAPRLLSLQIAALTATSVSFVLTASTTTRSLDSLEFVFQPAPGASTSLTQSSVTIPVGALADNFFRSTASATTGGVVTATVPFTLTFTSSGTPPNLTSIIVGVSVTAVNSLGRSNSLSIPLL